MLPLLFAMVVFFFLLVGAVMFLACVLVPTARQYALSVALWFAALGPCAVALMMLAGLAIVADAFITKTSDMQSFHTPTWPATLGWGYAVVGVLVSGGVATVVAWLHQAITRRLTFLLFRLYVTAVIAGIGSVFGWALSWWLLSTEIPHVWIWSLLGMLILVVGFGAAAYKGARGLRGDAPTKFPWVSPEEFAGS
jgi:hypothetical protein